MKRFTFNNFDKSRLPLLAVALIAFAAFAGASSMSRSANGQPTSPAAKAPVYKVVHTDAQWRKLLTPAQYDVLRESGTELAYSGALWNNHAKGTYVCAACGQPLFSSTTKFESGTGWPSFYEPLAKGDVLTRTDNSLGMERTEVLCPRCGSHLGHVFDDGPQPTGLRYCMNSVAMKFIPAK